MADNSRNGEDKGNPFNNIYMMMGSPNAKIVSIWLCSMCINEMQCLGFPSKLT